MAGAMRDVSGSHSAPVLVALSVLLSGCDRDSTQELKTWTPADHDNQKNPTADQVDTKARQKAMPQLQKYGINDVILATWKQNCVQCHGQIGRGDGPQAARVKPPDLTSPTWQKNALDSEIARTIEKGRGQMPPFGHLPKETIEGLVKLVRLLDRDRTAKAAAEEVADEEKGEKKIPEPSEPAPGRSEHGETAEPADER